MKMEAVREETETGLILDLRSLTPYEVCEQYANGRVGRDETFKELAGRAYETRVRTTSVTDDLVVNAGTSIASLQQAFMAELIDADLFYQVIEHIEERMTAAGITF